MAVIATSLQPDLGLGLRLQSIGIRTKEHQSNFNSWYLTMPYDEDIYYTGNKFT